MEKLKLQTPDLAVQNEQNLISLLKEANLFPNCVTEMTDPETGKIRRAIDFDLLRQELSNEIVEGPQERYRLDWPGKREALALANSPIRKTLRPCKEESVDFDTTQNLYIEGDNLDALKLLQETYLGKIKMIYIDPPYNTGNDFIYDDNFSISREEYDDLAGARDEEGNAMFNEEKWKQNSTASGRFHSEWLSMIYARMKLARNLLSDEGVILVHIDENEIANASKVMTEIFGPENRLGEIVWDKKNPKGDATKIAIQHEYILAYTKSHENFKISGLPMRPKSNALRMIRKATQCFSKIGREIIPSEIEKLDKTYGLSLDLNAYKKSYTFEDSQIEYRSWLSMQDVSGGEAAYKFIDADGNVYRPVSMAWPNKKLAPDDYQIPLKHPVTGKPCPVPERGWRNPSKTMRELLNKNQILFGEDELKQPERKYLLKDNLNENVPSVMGFGGSDDALFSSLGLIFDNPKPVDLAAQLLRWFTTPNDGVFLDFFSGSATTAHAVMQLNAEDGGNRRHIMVQLPEPCDEKSEAFKAGFKTITEIGKERIRRAGKKIRTELEEKLAKELKDSEEHSSIKSRLDSLDTGFRVIKIDSSNMADVYYQPDALTQDTLALQVDNLKPGRKPEDLLFQVLLDWGVDIALPITEEKILKHRVFFVADNALSACFDTGLDETFVKELAKRHPLRAVFRDSGYASDAVKINFEQIFKALSPHTEIKTL
jgi:adenine-specific DNA-methyltransferase